METRSQLVAGASLPPYRRRLWRRYVAVGDSLSEGLGDPLPGGAVRGWATLCAEHLRQLAPDLEFTNLAVRGHRTRDAIRRQLPAALELRPDLVTVFIGGNDVLLNVRLDRARLAEELDRLVAPLAQPGVTVVLSTLPDLAASSPLLPPLRGRLRRRVETVNEVIRDTADRYETVLLDAWADPRTRRHAMWSVDRIHPSAEGHRLIAASVAELLGVPVPANPHRPALAAPAAVMRRYAGEALWLLRHGVTPEMFSTHPGGQAKP
jgi:lysophospholipase L1-like esterase